MDFSVTLVEDTLYLLTKEIGLPAYDYEFSGHFACKHPLYLEDRIVAVGRIGATNDYPARYKKLLENNIRRVHTPEEYLRTSFLPNWYPLIKDFTPKSQWFERQTKSPCLPLPGKRRNELM